MSSGRIMIDLFTIFGKGGIVLWCFQESSQLFKDSINQFIRNVLLEERVNSTSSLFKQGNIVMKYKFDNEFELIFLILYQSAIQLSYGDQLLTDVQKKFRDMYKNILLGKNYLFGASYNLFRRFDESFKPIYIELQRNSFVKPEKVMRKFEESEKSKKTISSMVERPQDRVLKMQSKEKEAKRKPNVVEESHEKNGLLPSVINEEIMETEFNKTENEEILRKRMDFLKKKGSVSKKISNTEKLLSSRDAKKTKKARTWDLTHNGNGKGAQVLDYSEKNDTTNVADLVEDDGSKFMEEQKQFVGQMRGELPGIDVDVTDALNDFCEENGIVQEKPGTKWFSALTSLVGNKKLVAKDIEPVVDRIRENLLAKNVASSAAEKLCESVAAKLEGKVVGTFSIVASIVHESFREALAQILTPKRRVDILRDIIQAKSEDRPYVVLFCGVNGVGKSTNLAKITFWLNENDYRVLIVAGDTFRAGAVEQLRTHTKHLNALHPNKVVLYEQGYGKDPAGLTAAAISMGTEQKFDAVLVDTAGRMQDNEPLMRSLVKQIRVNEPDLILFVGEALVGNDAVDQLVKFNQALADFCCESEARLIDGIVLTKFDTIDDKVGAAVSMTYITGQPIVFVGTGQTYSDLKNLDVDAVVKSLIR